MRGKQQLVDKFELRFGFVQGPAIQSSNDKKVLPMAHCQHLPGRGSIKPTSSLKILYAIVGVFPSRHAKVCSKTHSFGAY